MAKPLSPNRMFRLCTPGSELDTPEFGELAIAYAQAMWSWSRVESKLFLIFAHAVEPNTNNHSRALRAAFFSIVSPLGRLDMIHSVAQAMWKKSGPWKEWLDLYAECREQLKIRGKLAHLVGHAIYPPGKNKKPQALILEPVWHPNAPHTHGQAKNLGYTTDQLSQFARSWQNLNERLGVFCAFLEHQMQPGASPELTARLRHLLRNPNARTRAKSK